MNNQWRRILLLGIIAGACALTAVAVQDEADEERRIWNRQLREARERARTSRRPPQGQRAARAAGEDLIGLTYWRLRDAPPKNDGAKNDEDGPRMLKQRDGEPPIPQKAERVSTETQFDLNDPVRLSIEITREGDNYLYVIDREMYKGGDLSAPQLIFPNPRIRGGSNKVTGSQLVDIPAATDDPPFFNFVLSAKNPKYVGEQLTIIVSPKPLPIPAISDDPVGLDPQLVAQWEARWGGKTERREARGTLGAEWTKEEKQAAETGQQLLEQSPLPQSLFRIHPNGPNGANADSTMLLVVKMNVKR